MPDSPSSLPAIPSLEQLKKRAKDLLKAHHAGDPAAQDRFRAVSPGSAAAGSRAMPEEPQLADAQFVLAREHGFDSWAKLKHHLESLHPPGFEHYEALDGELAVAHRHGNATAVREINSVNSTKVRLSLEPDRHPVRRLPNAIRSRPHPHIEIQVRIARDIPRHLNVQLRKAHELGVLAHKRNRKQSGSDEDTHVICGRLVESGSVQFEEEFVTYRAQ